MKAATPKPIAWIVIPCYNEQEVLPITAPLFLGKIRELADTGKISENKKKDVPSRTVNQYSAMSTKNIKKTDKYSTRVSNAREKELESIKNNGKKYRKGSLTAIANMNIEAADNDPDQKK